MTPREVQETAQASAEAIRALNHTTRPGALLDVTDIYALLGELSLMTGRLPQLLRQLEDLVDDLVEAGDVRIVDGPNAGDPAAVGAITGHWLAAAAAAAHELAHRVEAAQQTLADAARADRADGASS